VAFGVRISSSTNSSKWPPKIPRNDVFSANSCSVPKLATLPQTPTVLIGYRPNHGGSGSDGSGEYRVRSRRSVVESFWTEVLMFGRFVSDPELRSGSFDGQPSNYCSIRGVDSE
jgi:hypothetical protein